jgi:hypothetical protein
MALGRVILHQMVFDEPRAGQDAPADDIGLDRRDDGRDGLRKNTVINGALHRRDA